MEDVPALLITDVHIRRWSALGDRTIRSRPTVTKTQRWVSPRPNERQVGTSSGFSAELNEVRANAILSLSLCACPVAVLCSASDTRRAKREYGRDAGYQ